MQQVASASEGGLNGHRVAGCGEGEVAQHLAATSMKLDVSNKLLTELGTFSLKTDIYILRQVGPSEINALASSSQGNQRV
jgi:hypothetical protein